MISLKSSSDIEAIGRAGAIIGALYREIPARARPGATTEELDRFAESFIRDHDGAEPAFKGLYGFPATLCISVNNEVVHGIPSTRRRLKEGDAVTVDCGVELNGFFADAAVTVPVGKVDAEVARLIRRTREAMEKGIEAARPGNRLGDIGAAIQAVADAERLGVVRELVGHGIGFEPHEDPQVPNYGTAGRGIALEAGLVIAIEPMLTLGTHNVRTLPDRWTVVTADQSVAAHFEHTVAVTAEGPRVLTG